jgi:hypothetical protein
VFTLPRLTLLLLLGAALLPASALAGKAAPSFSIRPTTARPGYFVLDARPGQRLQERVRIVNTGGKQGTVYLYPVDATTGATSGAVYLARARPRRSVGRWLRLPLSRLELSPKESRTLTFTVTVPRHLRPGQHLGGIVAENADVAGGGRGRGRQGLRIRIRRLSIVAVQVNTPGRRQPAMMFAGVTAGGSNDDQVLLFSLRNSGNILLKPKLSFAVTNCKGQQFQAGTYQLDTFVPQTAIRYPVAVRRKALAAGDYCAAGRLQYAGRTTRFKTTLQITQSQVTQVFSSGNGKLAPPQKRRPAPASAYARWPYALGALALVLLAALLLLLLRSRRRA